MKIWQLQEGQEMLYQDLQTILLILDKQDFQLIYYHGGWFLFSEGIVVTSVEVIIDYYCTILRKEYLA